MRNSIQPTPAHQPLAQAVEHITVILRNQTTRPILLTMGAWLLVMISVPIWNWTVGEMAMIQAVTWGVVFQTLAVVTILRREWSWATIGRTLLIVAIFTLAVEAIGTATGFPFGRYTYTDRLQPQLFHVPLLIPLAWFMFLPSAWAIAQPLRTRSPLLFALAAAGALTAWDLFLDPQMVGWQLWIWEQPSGYFGIPWSNYAGWFGTAFVLTLGLSKRIPPFTPATRNFLLLIYSLTWFLEAFGLALFWGQPGPAVVGAVVMGGFMLWGIRTATVAAI